MTTRCQSGLHDRNECEPNASSRTPTRSISGTRVEAVRPTRSMRCVMRARAPKGRTRDHRCVDVRGWKRRYPPCLWLRRRPRSCGASRVAIRIRASGVVVRSVRPRPTQSFQYQTGGESNPEGVKPLPLFAWENRTPNILVNSQVLYLLS